VVAVSSKVSGMIRSLRKNRLWERRTRTNGQPEQMDEGRPEHHCGRQHQLEKHWGPPP
jgi:hypothetical protein